MKNTLRALLAAAAFFVAAPTQAFLVYFKGFETGSALGFSLRDLAYPAAFGKIGFGPNCTMGPPFHKCYELQPSSLWNVTQNFPATGPIL